MLRKPSCDDRIKKGQSELNREPVTLTNIMKLLSNCMKEGNIKGTIHVVDGNNIDKVYLENKTRNIVWVQFVTTGHVAVVGAGNDIGFSQNESRGTWKILCKLKRDNKPLEWDTTKVVVISLKDLDTLSCGIKNVTNILKCRNGVEHYIGEYLIQNGVPILNYYQHQNYTEEFWKMCVGNNYDI